MEKRLKEGQKEILTHILNRMPKGEFILTTSFMEPSYANLANHGSARISRVDSLLIVNIISFAFLSD